MADDCGAHRHHDENGTTNEEVQPRWFTVGVGSVGAASLFSDTGHEIVTALLPSFLTSVLHSSAASLGAVEGFSDALMGVARMIGGPLANQPRLRQRLATSGYVGTAVATGAIGLTVAVWQAGLLRAIGWASRGLRSPARDALLAGLVPPGTYGRTFGVERAGDNLGAVIGPLLAAALVGWIGVRPTIYVAFLPGLLAAVAITVAARESRRQGERPGGAIGLRLRGLHEAGLLAPLTPVALFEFGNVAVTLLILRATQLLTSGSRSAAMATSLAVLVYAAHNALGAVVALVGGRWVDVAGPRRVFAAGAVVYVLAYAGFAIGPHDWWWLLVAFTLAGSGIGIAETAESTLVAQILPDALRGSGFGVLGGIQATGDLVSTVVVGALYTAVSPTAGFVYADVWMLTSVAASALVKGRGPSGGNRRGARPARPERAS